MVVQIHDLGVGGHHTNYVHVLLRALRPLLEAKQISKIVVTMSASQWIAPAFQEVLSRYSSIVEFDASLTPNDQPIRSQAGALALLRSVGRFQSDYLILTSADYETVGLALQAASRHRSLPKQIHSVGLIHHGYFVPARTLKARLRDEAFRLSWRFSPLSEIRLVNPFLYEELKKRGDRLGARVYIVPHPVERHAQLGTIAARRALGIPADGCYIGFVGEIDQRKAIPELLSAFRAATSGGKHRLLLAGQLHQQYLELIQREYADLVRQERIVLINRHLTTDEMNLGLCALDVCAPVYYPRQGLSASLLAAVFARRPVIAGSYGYTGMVIDRFRLGWSCDVSDVDALVSRIRTALERCAEYNPGERLTRLMEFHDPKNYADTVLGALYGRIGLPIPRVKTWEWATALPGSENWTGPALA